MKLKKKDGEKRIDKRIKMALICVLVLALAGSAVYAAYTNQGYKKGIVSTNRGAVRFSSNVLVSFLEGGTESSKTQFVSFNEDITEMPAYFSIFNYPVGNTAQPSSVNITYKLKFEIIGDNTAAKPSIKVGEGDFAVMTGMTMETQYTLTGGTPDADSYGIKFPKESVGAYQLKVTATPADAASKRAAQNHMLSCLYVPVQSAGAHTMEYVANGGFTDLRTGKSPADYHAFNYLIELQNYTGTIHLSWDEQLELDPFFKEEHGLVEERTIEITTEDVTANYEIVFYRTSVPFTGDWGELDALVNFEADQVLE